MDMRKLCLTSVVLGLIFLSIVCGNDEKNSRDSSTEVASTPVENAIQIVPDAEVRNKVPDQESFITDHRLFVPTKDWQHVAEGQAIPHGLHVRLNLETGLREARLLDEEDAAPPARDKLHTNKMDWFKASVQEAVREFEESNTQAENMDQPNQPDGAKIMDLKKSAYTREELKEALKKFKATQDDVKIPTVEDVAGKTKFRSIDEIQTDFKNLGMNIRTDLESLRELFKHYQSSDISDTDRVTILNDFEYYLHQIDNAVNFADMGGIQLLLKDLNSTNSLVRGEAAFVLASALQSNPKVQITALEEGAMHQLLRLLSLDPDTRVRTRALVALSALVRHFPYAQLRFVELGGIQVLSPLIRDISSESQKLAIKAVTLINDLMLEKLQVSVEEQPGQTLEQLQARASQYEKVQIMESVVEQGWCRKLPELLRLPEHDTREKVLNVMATLQEDCYPYFGDFRQILQDLRTEYSSLASEEESSGGDSYFKGLLTVIESLIRGIGNTPRTEL